MNESQFAKTEAFGGLAELLTGLIQALVEVTAVLLPPPEYRLPFAAE
jgi:hypothetical protein